MAPPLGAPPAWDPRRGSLAGVLRAGGPAVAQAGVLGGSRVQLENGLARTKAKADLGAGGAAPLYLGFIPGGSDDLRWAARKKPGSRGGWLEGRQLDRVAEVGEPADEPPGLHLPGTPVEVVGPEVRVGGAVLQHVVGGGQDRGRDRARRPLRPAAGAQAVVLGLQVAGLLAARRPGALHQRGLEPGRALAQARGAALARAL